MAFVLYNNRARSWLYDTVVLSAGCNAVVVDEILRHSRRTGLYVRVLAHAVGAWGKGRSARYVSHMNELLGAAAVFHDAGKFAVPASILGKRGRLSTIEFEAVQHHPLTGAHMIRRAATGMPSLFARCAVEMAEFHHEHWDGSGYPFGIKGKQIPFAARIMTIADVYDALVHSRVYKAAIEHEDAVRIICDGAGTAFDPWLVEVFAQCSTRFFDTSERLHESLRPRVPGLWRA